jgi:hypothetical protein
VELSPRLQRDGGRRLTDDGTADGGVVAVKGVVAAVALCCLIHAGIAGALLGWWVRSWTSAFVATAVALVLVVVRRRARGGVASEAPCRGLDGERAQ